MACKRCEKEIGSSYKEKPFYPPGGYRSEKPNTYICSCGQKWWCSNDYYCLWNTVDDDFTWEVILAGCDIPIAIGNPCVVIPGYEKFRIKPVHAICREKVIQPKISFEPDGKTVMVQWIGDYPKNILHYQFNFPICCKPEHLKMRPDLFSIVYLGSNKNCPTFESPKHDEEKTIAHLISPDFEQTYSTGPGPISFATTVVSLGDPNVGVIRPRNFFDPLAVGGTVWLFNKTRKSPIAETPARLADSK